MTDLSALTDDPMAHARKMESPAYKRAAYVVLRPLLDRLARRHLSATMLTLPALTLVLPERGFPLATRRGWLARYIELRGARLLIQGTGSGWDTLSWLECGARPVGVELYPFLAAWNQVGAHGPRFVQTSLTALPFTNGAFDAAASDAVFEHCRDLDAVLAETVRVLRPGGYVYATYGPLWYCWGGDHFSGIGGLEYGYSHVERSRREYDEYVAAFASAEADAQGGARYVALDLFSRLTTQQYLDAFARARLTVVDLRLEISAQAVAFRRRWPDRAAMITRRCGITPDDLVVKANFVILRSQSPIV